MTNEKNTILIVDDHKIDREILKNILSNEYNILEAENGRIAFEYICQNPSISVVLLDLVMPEMNGFEFLSKIKNSEYDSIPIIVMTAELCSESEEEALDLGAIDYIEKPINSKILISRVHNAVLRNQMVLLEKLKYISTHDTLTGLYNRNKMFEETKSMLFNHKDKKFVFIRYDIDRFRLYNSAMGEKEGNKLLKFIAEKIRNMAENFNCCTFGRVDADVFCMCEPYDEEKIKEQVETAQKYRISYRDDYVLDSTFGVYIINDINENIEAMYTKSSMAADKCKYMNGINIAFYEDGMGEDIARERWVIKSMKKALEQKQFHVFLQPKYNIKTGMPCGAEALVRWISPEVGMISPNGFIPIFEKNGFVSTLDYYMWENVCILLKRWKKEKKKVDPISVNMSRISLYNPRVSEILKELVLKYEIEPELLNLEITESAYMSNPELMRGTIAKLHAAGFIVLMDDFGSGYSSLNTLKEIEVDILKVDMNFLPNEKNDVRSEKILSSIIRMAGWLGMPVIAEGVETYEQKEFLESIGCVFVQGYYYAKPMPVSDYEKIIEKTAGLNDGIQTSIHREIIDAVWSSNPQIDDILKSISLPVMIVESTPEMTDIVRTNKTYLEEFGFTVGKEVYNILSPDDEKKAKKTFFEAKMKHTTSECEVCFWDNSGNKKWLRMKVKLISQIEKSDMFCVIFIDISLEKAYENKLNNIFKLFKVSTKKKMLVIDDQKISRQIITGLFSDNFNVIEAKDGIEGLKLLQDNYEDIAIIILDMIMPEMNGEEFLVEKKKLNITDQIPIIVVSSESKTDIQLSALKLGVNDYITKPFEPEITKQKVKNVLEYNDRFKKMINDCNNK